MAKSKQKKEEELKVLNDRFNESKSVVFANYDGLKVKEVEELRNKCREAKVDYLVVKKTLLKKSLEESKLENKEVDNYRFLSKSAAIPINGKWIRCYPLQIDSIFLGLFFSLNIFLT